MPTTEPLPHRPSRAATSLRAALSLFLLLGFYLIAAAAALGVLGLSIWVTTRSQSAGAFKILAIGLGITAAIVIALWRSLRTPPFVPHGLRLTPEAEPELWALTADTARRVGTRVPDEIWVIPEINAAVVERTKLLGLVGGRRYMMVGLPLLAALSTDAFRGVIAHELGHYSHSHTRLGAIAYRGHIAIGHMLAQFAGRRFNPLTWIFRGYAVLYGLVQSAVSRSQEFEADRVAGRIAGREPMRAALTELIVLDRAWDFYMDDYVSMGLGAGLAPRGVYAGFGMLLDGRGEALRKLREELPEQPKSLWDSHPPIPVRVAALADAPERGEVSDPRPARALLGDFAAVAARVESFTFDMGDREVLDWPDYIARSFVAQAHLTADAGYRAAGRAFRVTTLAEILERIETEGPAALEALRRANFPEGAFAAMVVAAGADSGVLRVELRWDGPLRVHRVDGEEFDLKTIVEAIETDPEAARILLADLGLDMALAKGGTRAAEPTRIGAAVANVQVNGVHYDALLTDEGVLFLPCPSSTDDGEERLARLVSHPQGVRALMTWPNAWWLPYEEVAGAEIRKAVPVRAVLRLHSGADVEIAESWTGDALGDSEKALRAMLTEFAQRGGR
ncbi:hypothetical protein Afil01_48570 [Actinorhabdospora filicis]|uniref:Peptidase M48 domain-containing protein n=1 Tax=Actinorhabdospora filicis TaxID=1785913 RepID=A0A9W6SNB5_9ACTN|nr:M48 family metallopeptidase [Actinorhabdospora filicis]GLZ80050.1 hypothetical protein Afil01_48570 [Actinorhabdospora filicis]